MTSESSIDDDVRLDTEPTSTAPADEVATDPPTEVAADIPDDGRSRFTALLPIGVFSSWLLLLAGIAGMAASATLTLERIELLKDPNYTPSCSINPVLSCGSVMVTDQAAFFGFPNPLLGLPAFAVIITTAILSIGRVRLPRWYWIGQAIVTALGVVFIHYLIFQSLYRINALCPYCMVVWAFTPIVLIISISQALGDSRLAHSVKEWMWVLLPVWYTLVIVLAGERFWYYWKTLF